MVGRPLKGPQAIDGFISAMEYPTGIIVTIKEIRRMLMKKAFERDVRYSCDD